MRARGFVLWYWVGAFTLLAQGCGGGDGGGDGGASDAAADAVADGGGGVDGGPADGGGTDGSAPDGGGMDGGGTDGATTDGGGMDGGGTDGGGTDGGAGTDGGSVMLPPGFVPLGTDWRETGMTVRLLAAVGNSAWAQVTSRGATRTSTLPMIVATGDGGRHWKVLPWEPAEMPSLFQGVFASFWSEADGVVLLRQGLGTSATASLYSTTDGGESWTGPVSVSVPGGTRLDQIESVHFVSATTGYLVLRATGADGPVILKTDDGGASFAPLSVTFPGGTVQWHGAAGRRFYVVADGTSDSGERGRGLFVSEDEGASWRALYFHPGGTAATFGCTTGPVLTCWMRYTVDDPYDFRWRIAWSEDEGATWSETGDLGPAIGAPVWASARPGGVLYAIVSNGTTDLDPMYVSTDGGASWTEMTFPASIPGADPGSPEVAQLEHGMLLGRNTGSGASGAMLWLPPTAIDVEPPTHTVTAPGHPVAVLLDGRAPKAVLREMGNRAVDLDGSIVSIIVDTYPPVDVSPDGALLAGGRDTVRVWSLSDPATATTTLTDHRLLGFRSDGRMLLWSGNRSRGRLSVADSDGSGETALTPVFGPGSGVSAGPWDADGRALVFRSSGEERMPLLVQPDGAVRPLGHCTMATWTADRRLACMLRSEPFTFSALHLAVADPEVSTGFTIVKTFERGSPELEPAGGPILRRWTPGTVLLTIRTSGAGGRVERRHEVVDLSDGSVSPAPAWLEDRGVEHFLVREDGAQVLYFRTSPSNALAVANMDGSGEEVLYEPTGPLPWVTGLAW